MKTQKTIHILLTVSCLALATTPGQTQADGPLPIIWQATYGPGKDNQGLGGAAPYDFAQTLDGVFLITGHAYGPANGIRTEPICAGPDIWTIKIDSQGQRQWDGSCGGDIGWAPGDQANRILLTPDGGFIVFGFSTTEPGCCKTAPLIIPPGSVGLNHWAVRYDADGNKLWDKSYLPDGLIACWQFDADPTADGGYLSCGTGITGGENAGYFAIVKLNAQGDQVWTKKIGCETTNFAEALRIRETVDGGFIVAGQFGATPCGDKTSPYFGGYDPDNPYLGSDIWVVRFDAQQNKLWDKSYGGQSAELALDIHPLADGGFMVFGASQSLPAPDPTKGTKTSPRYGNMMDYWVIRIDAQGNQLWDKSYGGGSDDVCTHAEPMPDGGWLLSGTSMSLPSGNKTSPRFGSSDFWIVRIDEEGNKLWDQSFGGSGLEGKAWRVFRPPQFSRERIRRTADGGFLLTGYSESPVSGLKTAPLISQGDYWVLKLGPEPPSLRGEMTAEGKFQLRLIGPPEFQHIIQGSPDLVAWTDLVILDNPTGKAFWTDQETASHRFYRAMRKQP